MTNNKPLLGNLLLTLAALIWGCAFVAQSMGMDHMGPFTFQAVRSLIGAGVLLPMILLRIRGAKRRGNYVSPTPDQRRLLLWGGTLCGILLAVATNLQQMALTATTAGKAGFLTALYILFVPVTGIFVGRAPRPALWLCIAGAAVGLYLLSVKDGFSVDRADILLLLCAVCFTAHILVVDRVSPHVSGVQLSAVQFLVSGILSSGLMFAFEQPRLAAILQGWAPLLYTGVLSSGVAYTLQILGQRLTTPVMASLLMSMEAPIALIAGMVILGESMSARELVGFLLMLAAILLAQWVQFPKRAKALAPDALTP